jgi:outer membrane receptor protein involved in Fe transport
MCHLQTPFLTQVKLLGSYLLPKVEVQFAATLQNSSGAFELANYVALNSVIAPSLGRPLSGGAASATVGIVAPGTLYGERPTELDVRFGKAVRYRRIRATLALDIYNLLNANAITNQNNNVASNTTATWLTPTVIMNARLFKFSLTFQF